MWKSIYCIGTPLSCNIYGKPGIADSTHSLGQMVMLVKEQLSVCLRHRCDLQAMSKLLIAGDLLATGT